MKRVLLFLLTNLGVMLVLGLAVQLLGLNGFLSANGLSLTSLLGFALVMGFGGAFISLLISKPMAKWTTGVQIIDPRGTALDPTQAWLVATVERHAQIAGIRPPEVGIYPGAPNAFATGAFRNSALVAVSSGLLQSLTREEVEAVIGHEVAHVANGDMVTLALIQGVMNTFVVFLSRVIGYLVDKLVLRNTGDRPGLGYYATTVVMDLLLGVVAALVVAWFSRQREFRADAGAARLMGRRQPMMNALARLHGQDPGEMPRSLQAMGISARPSSWMAWFASHPPMEERIERLRRGGGD
jgi:heat shock protein HtpX